MIYLFGTLVSNSHFFIEYNMYMHFLQNRSIELARGLRFFFFLFFLTRFAFLIVPEAQTNEFCIF
jgi:hypothetical protein